ncbi:MAG: hypothetical protein KAR00_01565 [Candidatus Pacebacteria bacterium]|nr:hypothetical protein [Candidatus Paceibacterota bacterium]
MENLGCLKIIRTPKGEAPLKIRKKWVGIQMRYLFFDPQSSSLGTFSETPQECRGEYFVSQLEAILALKKKSPDVALWWKKHGFPESQGSLFCFGKDEVQILKPSLPREQFLG